MAGVKVPPEVQGQKHIEIVIDEKGETTVEAHNFAGIGCREATASIEQTLGGVSSRKDKKTPGAKQTIRSK